MNDKEENKSNTENSVSLMTVHAAKGLEFKNVFIIAAEENIFPNERALNEKSEDEERRLFYVALTRAKETLYISRARKRSRFGQSLTRARRSRFLNELPENIITEKIPKDAFQPVSLDEMKKAFENFTF
jgi:DNA helicase-2/ATP-dependent DNA helicase PcrA